MVPQNQKGYKISQKFKKNQSEEKSYGLVDTMSSALFNSKLCMDEVIKGFESISTEYSKEMIDSLETYEKNYSTQSRALLKRAQDTWNKMNQDKLIMINQREEYLNAMSNLSVVTRKREEKLQKKHDRANSDMSAEGQQEQSPEKKKDPPMSRNPFDAVQKAKSTSMVAEGNYLSALDKYNSGIDTFNENFIPIMAKIQENDIH